MSTLSTTLIAVSLATIRMAESEILSCSSCDGTADIPFSCVLDRITDRNGAVTDYVMSEPARCPKCGGDVLEGTPVEWKR